MFLAGRISRSILFPNNLLPHSPSIVREITRSCVPQFYSDNSDKYQNLWGEDFDSIYCSKMPRSKEYVSTDDSSSSNDSDDKPKKKQKRERTKEKEDKAESSKKAKTTNKADEEEPTWDIGNNKQIKVREFKGKLYVDIREMYEKDGKLLPGKKGVALAMPQFNELMKVIHEVEEVAKAKAK